MRTYKCATTASGRAARLATNTCIIHGVLLLPLLCSIDAFSISTAGGTNPKQPPQSASATINQAKQNLRQALKTSNYRSETEAVQAAVRELAELNAPSNEADPCSSPLFEGHWLGLTAPTFPGRIEGTPDDVYKFKLGRMSFNQFQPADLVCTVDRIVNPVIPINDDSDSDSDSSADDEAAAASLACFSYSFHSSISIATKCGNDLPALLISDAICRPWTHTNEEDCIKGRVEVAFGGGSLEPVKNLIGDEGYNRLWGETFNVVMDQDVPQSFRYDVERPFKGFIDVLYLDEELRITRGNMGTIVIAERVRKELAE
mmetsp:Transcript_4162/g.6354  ORF Transcript_4162/g.6354 Transcript_4162/m.6354 type:complete len:316 (+) Transcript_4162:46-993(+)